MVFYRGKSRGRRGSRRGRSVGLVATAVGCLIGAAALGVGPAFAVHDETFQLDGESAAATTTTVGGTTQTVDWDSSSTAAGATKGPLPAGFTAAVFDRDFVTNANGTFNTSDSTTYTTGSKDTLPISWLAVHGVGQRQQQDRRDELVRRGVHRRERRPDPLLRPRAQRQHRRRERRVLVPPGRERRLNAQRRHRHLQRRAPRRRPAHRLGVHQRRHRQHDRRLPMERRRQRLSQPDPGVAHGADCKTTAGRRQRLRDRQHRNDHDPVADREQAGRRRAHPAHRRVLRGRPEPHRDRPRWQVLQHVHG